MVAALINFTFTTLPPLCLPQKSSFYLNLCLPNYILIAQINACLLKLSVNSFLVNNMMLRRFVLLVAKEVWELSDSEIW